MEIPDDFSLSGFEPLPDRWWTAFADPQLDEFVEEALAGNLSLRATWDRLAQVEAVARREGAPLVPAVDAKASFARTRTHIDGDTSSISNHGIGVAASYELDLWRRVRSTRDAARLDAEASAHDVTAAAISLSAAVAGTWYELAEAVEQQRVLAQQIETNEQVLELITLRFRQGQAQAADVFRQRQLLEATRGNLELEKARAGTFEHQLSVLLGRAPGGPLVAEGVVLREPPPLPATGLPASLVQSRPDVLSAYAAVQAADMRVAAAIADRLPRISIVAGADTGGTRADDLFDDWIANLAANLVAPVIDGGRRRAEVDRTQAALSEAVNLYGEAVLVSFREVEDALVREERQVAFLASLEKQLEIVQHVIDRTRDSYFKGQLDYLRVLDALTSRQSLERQYVAARRQRIGFRIDLARALAGGWPLAQPEAREIAQRSASDAAFTTASEERSTL